MSADYERVTEVKSGSRRRCWLVWGMAVSIVVLLFSPFLLFRAVNRAKFNRKVAELKAAGQPVSMDDLEAAYVLPDGVENAADVYLQAFSAYVEPNEAELALLPVRGKFKTADDMLTYPPEVIETIRVSLEKNKECLDLIDQASRMEYCLLPRSLTLSASHKSYWIEITQIARLVSERNIFLAQTQQGEELFESLLTSFGLSNVFESMPRLVEYLGGVSLTAVAELSLQDSLNLIAFTDEQLSSFQHVLRPLQQYQNLFLQALINERVGNIYGFSMPMRDHFGPYGTSQTEQLMYIVSSVSGLKDRDSVLLLNIYDQVIETLQLPVERQFEAFKQLELQCKSYSPLIHYFLRSTSGLGQMGLVHLRQVGGLRCAETALAVERYRLKYGGLPETLEALVPEFLGEVYLDPFDGKPLRYVLRPEGGYTVYSIGQDGRDNGGLGRKERTLFGNTGDGDLTFTVRR